MTRAVLLLSLFGPSGAPGRGQESQNTPAATVIAAGASVGRDLAGNQKHVYQITLPAGRYVRAVIAQRDVDVFARLLAMDGTAIVEYDAEPRKSGEEIIEFTSPADGEYRIVVEARRRDAPAGAYEISVAEVRAATPKDHALDEARRLTTEANRLWRADRYDEALPVAARALALREKELGPEHPDVGTSLFILGNQYNDKGDYDRAEELYLRALAVREKSLGPEHVSVSLILNNLGNLFKDRGDYVRAETFYERARSIREKTLDADHLLIAGVLNNLANVSRMKGDDARAAVLYERTLGIRERTLGPEHPDVATTLNNIANLYEDINRAEPLYARALAIREKVFGPDSPNVAQTLYNFAVLYTHANNPAKAKPLGQRALSIYEKALGADHPLTSYPLNLLAVIHKNMDDYAGAEALSLRAVAVKEKAQGPQHPHLAGTLSNLANLYALRGEADKAVAIQSRAGAILEYNINLNMTVGSERQKLAYLATLAALKDQTLTLNFQSSAPSVAATDLGATTVLQHKGRVLDSVTDSLGALRRSLRPEDQSLLDDLNKTTTRLVGLVLEGRPPMMTTDEHRRQIKILEGEREKLESEISRRSAGLYAQTEPVNLQKVQATIPRDAALIEFAVYRPISWRTFGFAAEQEAPDPRAAGAPRYAVYVITAQGTTRGKDLGPAAEIDAAINAFRKALRDPGRRDVRRLARAVDEKVMRPVREMSNDSARLLVSPDGELSLIPFAALVDEHGHYLVERHSLTYLTSGRDLLRPRAARKSQSKMLVIAAPSYGEPAPERMTRMSGGRKPRAGNDASAKTDDARDWSEIYFAPLGVTFREAQAIRAHFPEANLLTGTQATESALKRTTGPEILHVATHGFFLERRAGDREGMENPLLRGGRGAGGGEPARRPSGRRRHPDRPRSDGLEFVGDEIGRPLGLRHGFGRGAQRGRGLWVAPGVRARRRGVARDESLARGGLHGANVYDELLRKSQTRDGPRRGAAASAARTPQTSPSITPLLLGQLYSIGRVGQPGWQAVERQAWKQLCRAEGRSR